MTLPTTDPVRLAHDVTGPRDAPLVMLAPSLGTTRAMWDHLVESLRPSYRVVCFDTRGHGDSPVPPGPYTLDELVADVVALADSLGAERFGFVGLSLGGAIGQVLALTHPDRLSALVLCCTGPSFGEPEIWRDRARRVREEGMGWLVEPTKQRWFTPGFLRDHPQDSGRLLEMIASSPPQGYAAGCDALVDYDVTDRLGQIRTPTRVIAGAQDRVSGPDVARTLVEGLPDADLVILDDASHIANIAQPAAFDAAVLEHLEKHL